MIKLEKSGTLLCIKDIKVVKKIRTYGKGDFPRAHNSLEVTYNTGVNVTINYGYDEHYYDKDGNSNHSQRMNKDLKQIEEHLLVKE